MPLVQSFNEFREVVTKLGALDVNWTYSDISGNIGYQLGAPVPIRKTKNSYKLFEESDYYNEWSGFYPLDETPFALNPPQRLDRDL